MSIFPEPLGHYWVYRDDTRDWQMLFHAETAKWRSKLLEASLQTEAGPGRAEYLPPSPLGEAARRGVTRAAKKGAGTTRRSPLQEEIDQCLREIAEALPSNHEEVFRSLEGRRAP